ncbi:circadian clock KaiB family protein [Roseateles sp. GG27B]
MPKTKPTTESKLVAKSNNPNNSEPVILDMTVNIDQAENYILRLYIAGSSSKSMLAIENIKNICECYLHGKYELQVIDLFQQPHLARGEQIIAAPTLVKKLPLPLRRMIGDMSDAERVLMGLDLRKKTL